MTIAELRAAVRELANGEHSMVSVEVIDYPARYGLPARTEIVWRAYIERRGLVRCATPEGALAALRGQTDADVAHIGEQEAVA
jgi:hypothetical protein